MSTSITLNLSDETYRRAESLARATGRSLIDVLSQTLDSSLLVIGTATKDSRPVDKMTDEEVLALSDTLMIAEFADRQADLMAKQQAGTLSEVESLELAALLNVYQTGQFRKAQAQAEAIRRGLRKP